MDLHSGLPYWIIKNPLFEYFHPLEEDYSIDIAIVGAGIAGALTAHQLCKAGFRCCVVDKRSVATGSSAATTALLQYEVGVPLYQLIELIGEESAVLAYRACLQAIPDMEEMLMEAGVDAEFERVPSLFFASDIEGAEIINREYEVRQRHHLPVEFLTREELNQKYGLKAPGALFTREGAQMDAYKAAIGFLRYHIEKDGLEVFTHTEVTSAQKTEEGYVLETDRQHRIQCKYVVIAAGFEADNFLPKKVMQLTSTYALISHPLPAEMLWEGRCLIWETNEPYLYVRTTTGNRIIVGGEDEEFSNPEYRDERMREKIHTLEQKFRKLFPRIPLKREMYWSGTFSTTRDGLPFIGTWQGSERMFFNLGYGDNGILFSMIGAQMICNSLKGVEDVRTRIFSPRRSIKI